MKTILDKVDPKYLECATGLCEHSSHSLNLLTWLSISLVLGFLIGKVYTSNNIK